MSIISREILFPGKTEVGRLEPETKLLYHFRTVIKKDQNSEPVEVDVSKVLAKGQPVETIYGKQFKLPIWESCLTSMRIGEICRLTIRDDPITHYICMNYVVTSKCFRKHYGMEPTRCLSDSTCDESNQDHVSHNCSMSIKTSPYTDLNDMLSHPPEIFEFTFELVDVIPPDSYTKEIWQMNDDERRQLIPRLREEGNINYKEQNFEGAISCYTKGLNIIESLLLKEKPRDSDWVRLDGMRKPFLLNLAQVKLAQGEYYDCIKHCDEVLKIDSKSTKALFRRSKAHSGVWNLDEARKDLAECLENDKSMAKVVNVAMQEIREREKTKNKEDREQFSRMFSQS